MDDVLNKLAVWADDTTLNASCEKPSDLSQQVQISYELSQQVQISYEL